MGIMTSLYYTFTVWITICVNLVSAEPVVSVSGHVGSTAVLPCKLPSVDTEMPHIIWSTETEIVFERFGEETDQGAGYEGRVDVPEDELRKGKCSLVLRNLTFNDANVYKSYQVVKRTTRSASTKKNLISRVKLSVYKKPTIVHTEATDEPEGGSSAPVDSTIVIVFIVVIVVTGVIVGGIVYWRRHDESKGGSSAPVDSTIVIVFIVVIVVTGVIVGGIVYWRRHDAVV